MSPQDQDSRQDRKAVLIVEDDEGTAELERKALTRAGIGVRIATRVDAAVSLLREQSFSAILLDYNLPGGDPWTIVEIAQAGVPRTPVILVTAVGNERIASEAIHRGVDDYVKKESSFWERLPGIIARAQTLADAEQANAHLAAIVESSEDAIVGSTLAGTITSWNQGAQRIFGYSVEEILGKQVALLVPGDSMRERSDFQETLQRGEPIRSVETRRLTKDGRELDVSVSISPIRDSSGKTIGVSAILRDISEAKKAKEQLERTKSQLAEAQEIAHVGSWEWDIAANGMTWSDELYGIYGLEPRQLAATYEGFLERVHPDDRALVKEAIDRALQDGKPFGFEHRIVRPDGTVRALTARGRATVDKQGKPTRMAGTGEDITELKGMQARLVLSDRMASVGTLAAGVAHEINNPLAYLTANLDMIAEEIRKISGGSPSGRLRELDEMVKEARHGAERVRKVVRGLATFSRAEEERRVALDVRQILDLSINMAFNEIRHRAHLVKDYGEVPAVEADESRLGQVFVNLLINAAHAIPEGHVDRNEIRLSTKTDPSGMAVIEVRDTGRGIPREVLGRIFDPFFTTKAIGEGTGLGLSICHGIITALGGEIAVESEVGKGALFRVTLPAARLEPVPEVRSRSPKPAPSRRGRVLVVDDDAAVAGALRRMLAAEHEVTVVTSGAEALANLRGGQHFDVILCDLMMPEMTGMDLYAELDNVSPELLDRMIFITGGAFSPTARQFLDEVPNQRFEKPFDIQNLRAAVRSMLK